MGFQGFGFRREGFGFTGFGALGEYLGGVGLKEFTKALYIKRFAVSEFQGQDFN